MSTYLKILQVALNRNGFSVLVRCAVRKGDFASSAHDWFELRRLRLHDWTILRKALLNFLPLLVLALSEEALIGSAPVMLRDVPPVTHRNHILWSHLIWSCVLGRALIVRLRVEDAVFRLQMRVLVATTRWRYYAVLTVHPYPHIAEVSREGNSVVSVVCSAWIHF